MARRVKKVPTHGRCRWCGKMVRFVKSGSKATGVAYRLAKHKAIHEYEYRDDDLCPGSGVLRKHIPQHSVETHPQAKKKRRVKKRVV